MVGLRLSTIGSRIPLLADSMLFGVLVPIPADLSTVVTCRDAENTDVTLIRGQYLLFLQEIHTQSTFDCLVLYFRRPEVTPVAQT